MKLTTPEVKEFDSVFPAENWFLYWKTSPSLWKTKLGEYSGIAPIFIPIYWSLHNESLGFYDFGEYRPETNLKNLVDIAHELGKEVAFTLSIGPAPFLPNGGIPSFLANKTAMDEDKMALSCLDNEGRINKIYSYFDPAIFQAFRKFISQLNSAISKQGIGCPLYAVHYHALDEGVVSSFFQDRSPIFDQGFHRYIQQLSSDKPELTENLLENPGLEIKLQDDYLEVVQNLYIDSAKEILAANWNGQINMGLLGATLDQLLLRASDSGCDKTSFLKNALEFVTHNIVPSSILLSHHEKKGVVEKVMSNTVSASFIAGHLEDCLYDDEMEASFSPLVHFEIYSDFDGRGYDDNGLTYHLNSNYPWCYRIYSSRYKFDSDTVDQNKLYFFEGDYKETDEIRDILKLFMSGGKAFIDLSNASKAVKNKLDTFVIENSLETEKVNFTTQITKMSLGEGVLILFEGEKLKKSSFMKKGSFWETLIDFLNIKSQSIQGDEGVYYHWRARLSNTYELNYEQIRRLSIYNPTSYKKKVRISSSKNFAFLKTIDEKNIEFKSTPIGVELLLLPEGSVSLDFGYFE